MPKIIPTPKNGWGSLKPDDELLPETIAAFAKIRALPRGQFERVLTYALERQLVVHQGVEMEYFDFDQISASKMVNATSAVFNVVWDLVDGVEKN